MQEKNNNTKLLCEISSLEQALFFIEKEIDALVLNIKGISLTKQFNLYTNELYIIAEKAQGTNTKLFVNVDMIYHQSDFAVLKVIMKKLIEMEIKNLIITDVGVMEFAKRNHFDFNYFNGNSILNTNYKTMEFMSRYYDGYVISNEINIKETLEIVEKSECENIVQVFGKTRMFYSKRKLLTSYYDYTKQPYIDFTKNNKIVFDDESQDDNRTYIYEDDFGTYAYTYHDLDGTKYLPDLIERNLQYIFISNLFINEEKYSTLILAYNDYLKGKIDLTKLDKAVKNTSNQLSTSFFEDKTIFTIEEARLLERGRK